MSDRPDSTLGPTRHLRIFLCHSSADKPAVRELYQRLKADGFEPWLDEENLIPGQDWRREIPKAVRDSDVVIVCLSKGSTGKAGYVQKEIGFALDVAEEQPEDTIFIIPLKLEECKVPDRLSRWQWVNYFASTGYDRLLRALHARAESLEIAAVSQGATEQPQKSTSTVQPASDSISQSGGVNVGADRVSIGEDVIGRDKVVSAGGHIVHAEAGATVIINEKSLTGTPEESKEQQEPIETEPIEKPLEEQVTGDGPSVRPVRISDWVLLFIGGIFISVSILEMFQAPLQPAVVIPLLVIGILILRPTLPALLKNFRKR